MVPDVPSFAVDDGFWYSIPRHLDEQVRVGSLVRVPLSGRRVRGWVVETGEGPPERKLKDVSGVSGEASVFDETLLRSLIWMSTHYVAPLSVLLAKATPPNLPRPPRSAPDGEFRAAGAHPIIELARAAARGDKVPVRAMVGSWQSGEWLVSLGPVLEAGKSVLVVAASAAEVATISTEARDQFGRLVVEVSGDDNAELTLAWSDAQLPARLIIGTPRVAQWKVPGLSLAVVLEEGRRAMKERQTPTLQVRDVIRTRSLLEGFIAVFLGPTPSVELLWAGAQVRRLGNRAWPLVETVDRSQDPPGSGFLSDRVVAALRATTRRGGRCFVFTHRRAGAGSMRCARCRAIRACPRCGSYVGRVEHCPRCGAALGPCTQCRSTSFEEMGTIPQRLVGEIARHLGANAVSVHPADTPVTVGTERDLAALPPVTVAVAADADGMLMGSGYRTTEEALRQLARVAGAASSGRGSRMMVQTSRPDSDLVRTLRRGDPISYLEKVLAARAAEGMPPATEMIALELRGKIPEAVDVELGSIPGATALGPAVVDQGVRWLLTGDLRAARGELRSLVGRWRDEGTTVRVDADPIDL